MKMVFVLACMLISSQVMAGKGKEILKKYAESDLLKNTIANIEKQHHVECKAGKARGVFPTVFGSVWYKTTCSKLGAKIAVKISSTFTNVNEPDFSLERIKVKLLLGNVLLDSKEQFLKSSDPFVEAFKKSELVRELRHMVEDNYKIVCSEGRASKSRFFGKGNYFYTVKCKSDTVEIKLKVKARVQIIGEDVFKFKLTKYKIRF